MITVNRRSRHSSNNASHLKCALDTDPEAVAAAAGYPACWQTSDTDVPRSAYFRAKTICSSVNHDFFIGTTSVQRVQIMPALLATKS